MRGPKDLPAQKGGFIVKGERLFQGGGGGKNWGLNHGGRSEVRPKPGAVY